MLGINDGLMGDDHLPFMTLSYANGPDHELCKSRGTRDTFNRIEVGDRVCA